MKLTIREIGLGDMENYIQLKNHIRESSPYLPYEQDENIMTNDAEQKMIENFMTQPNSTVLLAFNEDQLVGHIDVLGYLTRRQQHVAGLFLGVQEEFRGKGVGQTLLKETEAWALTHHIKRLELSIIKANEAVSALYTKHGYSEEGIRRQSIIINETFYDEIYLAKLLV